MSRLLWTTLVCTAAAVSSSVLSQGVVTAADFSIQENENGILVVEDGQPVLQYQRITRSQDGRWPRANYVHPLYDLQGNVITEDFPADHGHHRGIFWAWHQVLVNDMMMGDSWACQDFHWEVVSAAATRINDTVRIEVHVDWSSPALAHPDGTPIPFVRETTVITVHAREVHFRLIDFSISLRALQENVRIGGSDDKKGYGGFSPRIRLSDGVRFTSATGTVEPETRAVEAGPWMDIHDASGGLAILNHAENPMFPQPWILRRARSMQNAVYPGRTPVALSTKTDLRLRYRLVIHSASPIELDFNQMQKAFESP